MYRNCSFENIISKEAEKSFRLSFASKFAWHQSRGGILDLETKVEESIRNIRGFQ